MITAGASTVHPSSESSLDGRETTWIIGSHKTLFCVLELRGACVGTWLQPFEARCRRPTTVQASHGRQGSAPIHIGLLHDRGVSFPVCRTRTMVTFSRTCQERYMPPTVLYRSSHKREIQREARVVARDLICGATRSWYPIKDVDLQDHKLHMIGPSDRWGSQSPWHNPGCNQPTKPASAASISASSRYRSD
ncbi:hypothetical protein M3J09_013563 [Ascochyta lentis]